MGNPIVINANAYAPGTDVTNAISNVELQTYTHAKDADVITYENLTVFATQASPLGQPNVLASTGFNNQYMEHLANPQRQPLNITDYFSGLKITSTATPIDYFYFTGFNGPPDQFVMILFDQNGQYMKVITHISGVASYTDHTSCSSSGKPPCYSFSFGTYFTGQGVYSIAVGVQAAQGFVNLMTVILE